MQIDKDFGITSEGKTLEITPMLNVDGQTISLPPVQWNVPNWMVGYENNEWISSEYTFRTSEVQVSQTFRHNAHLGFMIRLREHQPDSEPYTNGSFETDDTRVPEM